ncbi:MAG: SCO family protein [Candidatus Sedimenticola sp. 4PFRAG1]
MRQKPSRNPLFKLVLFATALAVIYGGYHWGNRYSSYYTQTENLHLMQIPQQLTPFQLTDQHKKTFSIQRLKEHWSLIFFGYSHAEQTAGEMLTLATRVHNRLADAPELQKNLQVVFVTLDPQRDDHQVLEELVGRYSKDFIALTGDETEIRKLADQLGVIFKPRTGAEEGIIDHGTSMALIDTQGELTGLFKGAVNAASMAADIKTVAER